MKKIPTYNKADTDCLKELDSFTNRIIYTIVDQEAINEGGKIELLRQYAKIALDSIPDDLDTKLIIAFIIEPNGRIAGERIIKDKTGNVGRRMMKIAKSFKWTPGECDGRKVPTLVKLPLQICLH